MKFDNDFLNFAFKSWPYIVAIIPSCVGLHKSIKVEKIIAANKELVSIIQARAPITQEHYNQQLSFLLLLAYELNTLFPSVLLSLYEH